jgi:hypothetical protein
MHQMNNRFIIVSDKYIDISSNSWFNIILFYQQPYLKFQMRKFVQGVGDPSLTLGMTLNLGLSGGKEVAIREEYIILATFQRIVTSFPLCFRKALSSRALARDPRRSAGNCHFDLYSNMHWHSPLVNTY